MKKAISLILACLTLLGASRIPIYAQEASYNWYCVHAKDHVQPKISHELEFVTKHDSFYADLRHSEQTDTDKVIYLTFDAGYENGNIERVLDTLKKKNVPAAFFILGNLITHNQALVKRMANEGHTLCNHTVRHKDMSQSSDEALLAEIHELEALYEKECGSKMASYYRPPEGRFSKQNLICMKQNGYKTIFWSFAYPDWDNAHQMSCEKAKQIILENAHNGEVMLLHPTSQTNADILGEVIDDLRTAGYRFGTLDELTEA